MKTETEATTTKHDCFADVAALQVIDTINPATGRSTIQGETLEQIRLRYPKAEPANIGDIIAKKAAMQAASPRDWMDSTEERYWEMLEVLPPAAQHRGAFLVGEASDHDYKTGRPRFTCFKQEGKKFFELSTPITHAEFCDIFGKCANYYYE